MPSSLFRRQHRIRLSESRQRLRPSSTSTIAPAAVDENVDENFLQDEDQESNPMAQREVDVEEQQDSSALDHPMPIFSAAHLGKPDSSTSLSSQSLTESLDLLPVYTITHAIRSIIVHRCETTLSWEQLRSPQVSQFLIKPLQTKIRSSYFSRATLYALLVNCLQFSKESETRPATAGVCQTRALVSELTAFRLLKDYSSRELIDALSYDFDPLNGLQHNSSHSVKDESRRHTRQGNELVNASRTSTLEVAIRAEAKRFIAHPLVVQHLEAIWEGTVVFHSAADNLHRYPTKPRTAHDRHSAAQHVVPPRTPRPASHARSQNKSASQRLETVRRAVTLYDPSTASFFKLSRLRVPRYRQIFSTLSFAILLMLFLAVLAQRSVKLTTPEVLFWLWSAGFVLDELVCFSEQGFSLYIASVWNEFDLGILSIFSVYYFFRLASVMVTHSYREKAADVAYDVLASSAILSFPRLFSLLDHSRYFSQLFVAFRLMARDLVAVLILVAITCSGFFVCFWLSFGQMDFNGRGALFAMFQIFMGFTPAAWDVWNEFDILGKGIMALFLVIAHFLVVTILVTVLTNSMAVVVKNANEEHQFLFAINTISMVKSDALFSYIAPGNILALCLSPLRFGLAFPQFVKLNRTVIKATHMPILAMIFFYERFWSSRFWESIYTDERETMPTSATTPLNQGLFTINKKPSLRMPSAANFRKDQALDAMFQYASEQSKSTVTQTPNANADAPSVNQWMSMVRDTEASSPIEQPSHMLDRLEATRPRLQRSVTSQRFSADSSLPTRLIMSDQDNRRSPLADRSRMSEDSDLIDMSIDERIYDASGQIRKDDTSQRLSEGPSEKENMSPPTHVNDMQNPSASMKKPLKDVTRSHNRESSTGTVIFNPEPMDDSPSSQTPPRAQRHVKRGSRPITAVHSHLVHLSTESNSYERSQACQNRSLANEVQPSSSRPVMPGRHDVINKSAPDLRNFIDYNTDGSPVRRARGPSSYNARDISMDVASDFDGPSSFQTQMMESMMARRSREQEDSSAVGRMVLARMQAMEERFGDVLKEFREMKRRNAH